MRYTVIKQEIYSLRGVDEVNHKSADAQSEHEHHLKHKTCVLLYMNLHYQFVKTKKHCAYSRAVHLNMLARD